VPDVDVCDLRYSNIILLASKPTSGYYSELTAKYSHLQDIGTPAYQKFPTTNRAVEGSLFPQPAAGWDPKDGLADRSTAMEEGSARCIRIALSTLTTLMCLSNTIAI
jgi:hypothetical protein